MNRISCYFYYYIVEIYFYMEGAIKIYKHKQEKKFWNAIFIL